MLKSLTIDKNVQEKIELIFLREGYIEGFNELWTTYSKNYNKGKVFTIENAKNEWKRQTPYIKNKTEILQYLTLFENIIIKDSIFDLSKLDNYGLLEFNNSKSFNNFFKNTNYKDKHVTAAVELFYLNMDNVVSVLSKYQNYIFKYEGEGMHFRKQTKKHLRDYTITYLRKRSEMNFKPPFPPWPGIYIYVDKLFLNICEHFALSEYQSTVLYSDILSTSKNKNTELKLLTRLNYLAQTQLTDEIEILPYPKSLYEVLKIRDKKEMKRFREILRSWLKTLTTGDVNLEKKMRRDLKKANKELKYIGYWRTYKDSKLQFIINVAGNLLGLFGILIPIAEKGIDLTTETLEEKNSWITIVNKNTG